MNYRLRDYQLKAKQMISREFAKGNKKVMYWGMTGVGKGFSMSDFNDTALNAIPKQRVLNVMKRRAVVFQTIDNYKKYHGIEASPIMGTTKGHDELNYCQVASIDTIRARIKTGKYNHLKLVDLVVIDECHDMTSPSYKLLIWFIEGHAIDGFTEDDFELQKAGFTKYYIGLTATPFRVGNKTHTFWDSVVKPIEAHELRDKGILVDAREFAPDVIDVTGIRINRNGDFSEKELFERCTKLEVIGNAIRDYRTYCMKYAGRLLPAIYFCVNKSHSKIQTRAFVEAGIPARYCDESHSQKERDEAKADLKSGVILILLNVNIFSVGWDAPFVELIGGLRPTESENLAVQQWGRGLRPYKICADCGTEYGAEDRCGKCDSNVLSYEKQFCMILDHANNFSRHGRVYKIREPELTELDMLHKQEARKNKSKKCPQCSAVLEPGEIKCEYCGFDFLANKERNERGINEKEGELFEVDDEFERRQLKKKIIDRFKGYKTAQFIHRWDDAKKYLLIYRDFGDNIFMAPNELHLDDEKIMRLKEIGQRNKDKKINDSINKLVTNMTYQNKAVVT